MEISNISNGVGNASNWLGSIVKAIGMWISNLSFFEKTLGIILIISCMWFYKEYNKEISRGRPKK